MGGFHYAIGFIVIIAFCIWIATKDFHKMLQAWDDWLKRGRRDGR